MKLNWKFILPYSKSLFISLFNSIIAVCDQLEFFFSEWKRTNNKRKIKKKTQRKTWKQNCICVVQCECIKWICNAFEKNQHLEINEIKKSIKKTNEKNEKNERMKDEEKKKKHAKLNEKQ